MNTVGKFHITDTFTHRANKEEGVIVGKLPDGTVAGGNFISFMTKMGERTLRILDIENIKTISGNSYTGLLIEFNGQFSSPELKLLKYTEDNIMGHNCHPDSLGK